MKNVGIPNAEEHINDYPHQWQVVCVNVLLLRLPWQQPRYFDC